MTHRIIDTKSKREYSFEGELIGKGSTEHNGRPRWSEVELYRTPTGQYVLVKSGRSKLFHSSRSCSGIHAKQIKNGQRKLIEGVPCLKCGPADRETTYFKENDLVTVVISKSAHGVVESAHLEDEDNVVFLPNIARTMLEQASRNDTAIREAYRVEVVR